MPSTAATINPFACHGQKWPCFHHPIDPHVSGGMAHMGHQWIGGERYKNGVIGVLKTRFTQRG